MGAKSSRSMSTSSFLNLKSSQVDKVTLEFRKASGGNDSLDRVFEHVYCSLVPVTGILYNHLQNDGRVHVSKVLCVANSVFGDASEQSNVLIAIHGDVKSIMQSLVGVIAVRCGMNTEDSYTLLCYLLNEAPSNASNFDRWLISSPVGTQLVRFVYAPLIFEKIQLLPRLLGHSIILPLSGIIVINLHLPSSKRSEWTLLFSSSSHGSSFSQITKRINGEGPCLVIVESTSGRVFGCFASEGFEAGPAYRGDATCFLFEMKPNIHVFSATGFTKNYAYLNYQQSSLPNGLDPEARAILEMNGRSMNSGAFRDPQPLLDDSSS
uniref:MTOR-associated protein MEAK7 n=1 Tax=Heterorhabditis bacteriophora TaxID=37862 RepID=A0A1I7XP10_HETBA